MEISTIMGITAAFGLTLIGIILGGLTWFIDIPVILITLGATIGTTLINYLLKDMLRLMRVAKNAIFQNTYTPEARMKKLLALAQVTLSKGIPALQHHPADPKETFFRKGIYLAIYGLKPGLMPF